MAKYRYSKSSSPFDDAKNMYIMIGVCAVIVIAALVLCLTLQGDPEEPEIPVVEQGDGVEGLPDYGDTLTSIGDIIVDDSGTPVEEFVVEVTGADGLYQLDDATSLTISGQNAESFGFDLTVPGGAVSGTAYFTGERTAICEKADGSISFAFDAGAVYLTTDGVIDELGESAADGLYALIEAAPTTTTAAASGSDVTTTTTTKASGGAYDLDVIKSDSVQSALSGMMSSGDYSLMNDLLNAQGGYGIIYGTGDSSKEKQGRQFNLDTQLDAVMYYSFESGTGREVVVLCADGGKVYAGVCDGSEYRYYTNDSSRVSAADAPNYIAQYAKIKSMTLVSQ